MPALEAMSLGVPVVAASRGALPEVVGDAGILVAPDDTEAIVAALERVVSDDLLAEDLGRRGFERSRRFQWTETARAFHEVFADAIEQRAADLTRRRHAVS